MWVRGRSWLARASFKLRISNIYAHSIGLKLQTKKMYFLPNKQNSLRFPHTEAEFVGSSLVRESLASSTGDDDKLYFFFTERSQEQTSTYSHSRVAAVARVCKVSVAPFT